MQRRRPSSQHAVNLKSLARQLGISAMTVSNAFNRPEELSSSLRQRILSAAAQLGYHGPHPSGRMLRTGKTGSIALFNPDPIPHFFEDLNATAFMTGISEVCAKHQCGLTVLPPIREASQMTAIDKVAVDGFILYAIPDHSPMIKRVLGRQVPTVTVDMSRLPDIPAIGIDDRGAARKIARHVLTMGHRRIAVLSLEMMPDGFSGKAAIDRIKKCRGSVTHQRLMGYGDALTDAGLDLGAIELYEIRTNDDEESRYWATEFLSRKAARPTAILAMSDRMAFGAVRAAARLCLQIPRDLSIVGFDDIESPDGMVRLTTIRQPSKSKGQLAASLVVGDLPYVAEHRILPTEMIVRDSVAPPPTEGKMRKTKSK
jgi:DNA-binding LacI/PurR family transcriptional regulator